MTANETTDHAWVRENVATYLAGGLADDERARFEAHVGACGACLEDLQDAQGSERSLASVFEGDRPAPGLEDRIIRSLRTRPAPQFHLSSSFRRIGTGVAAVLLLGIVGLLFEGQAPQRETVASGSRLQNRSIGATSPSSRMVSKSPSKSADVEEGVVKMAESADDLARKKSGELLDQMKGESKDFTSYSKGEAGGYKGLPRGAYKKSDFDAKPSDEESNRRQLEKRVEESATALNAPPLEGKWFLPGSEAQALGAGGGAGGQKRAPQPDMPAGALAKGQEPGAAKTPPPAQDPQASQRRIIRQGELEFEVDSFDSSVDKVSRIAQEEKGYIATVNSDRLPNGKVKGTIVLRVPPEGLDRLVLKLRALGDLKSQRITSEDITKKYYDLESRLKAARTMETRLIEIIKTGKGEIKDILAAEKELGEWREKIEIFEGELRYYANLVSMSTLTLTLVEKDLRTPSVVNMTETVDTGIESEDVLKADKDLRTMLADAKGRITTSDLKKLAADQFSLLIVCEVPPENAGPLRDRLNQLGRIARLDVQTQTSDDGKGRPIDPKVKRSDTIFRISVYNTTNVQPRETNHLNVACADVEAAFRAVVARVAQAGGRVVQSNLNRLKADQIDGVVHFDVPVKEGEAVAADLRRLGEVMTFKVVENPDTANVTKSKKGFYVVLLGMAHVAARETTSIRFAARDVAATYAKLQSLVLEKSGRILDARLIEESRDNVSASLDVELPRAERTALDDALKAAGEVLAQTVQRATDDGRVVDSKIRVTLSLQTIASVGPRRIVRLGVEVSDVDGTAERIAGLVTAGGGQLVDSQNSRDPNGRAVSFLAFEAPLGSMAGFVDQIRKAGTVRMEETRRNPAAPESGMAIGRIELTLSNPDPLIGGEAGFLAQLKEGLRSVVAAAGFSLKLLLIGGLIVVPWALFVMFGLKLARRKRAKAAAAV